MMNNRLCKIGKFILDKEFYVFLSKDYLQVLVNMASMIQKQQVNATKFGSMEFTDEDLKNITLSFYENLDSKFG